MAYSSPAFCLISLSQPTIFSAKPSPAIAASSAVFEDSISTIRSTGLFSVTVLPSMSVRVIPDFSGPAGLLNVFPDTANPIATATTITMLIATTVL